MAINRPKPVIKKTSAAVTKASAPEKEPPAAVPAVEHVYTSQLVKKMVQHLAARVK